MKKKTVLIIAAVVVALLVITKPSKTRCINEFSYTAKFMATQESYSALKKDQKNVSVDENIRMHEIAESGVNPETYIDVNDFFLFTVIKYSSIDRKELLGIGILNTTISL